MAERTRKIRSLDLYLTSDEEKSFRLLVKQCGMTKSEFTRFVIRNRILPPFQKVKVKA